MNNIKKAYVELVELLEANSNKKVSTIMPQVLELVTKANNGGSEVGKTFYKDDEDQTIAVYCYYHKRWELISVAEYGAKKGTASGLNTMCKEGVSKWTKQQRIAKKEEGELLEQVLNGEVERDQVAFVKADIDERRRAIVPREDDHGFDVLEEALNAHNEELA
jgi:hypothetical protein